MYFWNIKALTNDLKNNRVSQQDQMHYYLGTNILVFILIGLNQLRNIILHFQLSTSEVHRLVGEIRKFFKVPVRHRGILYLRILQEDLMFWMIKAVFVALIFVVLIWGLYHCYKANGGAKGKDFVKRMVCLSFPMALRMGTMGTIITSILVVAIPEFLEFLKMAHAIQLILEELLPIIVLIIILHGMYKSIAQRLRHIAKSS